MFFILSKLFYAFIMPLTWITGCMLASLFVKKRELKKKFLLAAVLMIFFFGNEFIVNEIYLKWEEKPAEFSKIKKHYDVAVILGGVTKPGLEPRDRVYFDRGADRVVHPMFLYNEGKIDKFIASGGTGRLIYAKYTEGPSLALALKTFGVDPNDIIIEDKSRNTRENAVFSKRIIDSLWTSKKPNILIVTSAVHMPRAKRCFLKLNLKFDYLTTDFLGHKREFGFDKLFIPQIDAISKWGKLMKEWVGMITYKLAGYI